MPRMNLRLAALPAAALVLAACTTLSQAGTAEQGMMEADRAFAARAMEIGPGPAFVEFAAEDATIFPGGGVPETGKAAIMTRTGAWPADMVIEWAPEAAHAGKAGDFGYTWGYAKFTTSGQDGASYSKYLTVWQKQADGSWKWIADMGSPAPAPEDR